MFCRRLANDCSEEKTLQDKADIMSAIAILFKMKINVTKLRLFLLEHGQEHDEEEDATITIHT